MPPASIMQQNSVDANEISFYTINIPGNGDCFFNCVSLCLQGDTAQARYYRTLICSYICAKWEDWMDIAIIYHNPPGQEVVQTREDYFHRMIDTYEYATACEVKAAFH